MMIAQLLGMPRTCLPILVLNENNNGAQAIGHAYIGRAKGKVGGEDDDKDALDEKCT